MKTDNLFERRSDMLAGVIKRRMEFADGFFGVGERPAFKRPLNRTQKREYFWSLEPQKQIELWQQMDADERDTILGNDKPGKMTGEEMAAKLG